MKYMTQEEINALQLSKLDRLTPFAIAGVSGSQFSIARHYGGIQYNSRHYKYMPETDELIREDVIIWLARYRRAQIVM